MRVCLVGNSHAACVYAVQKYEERLVGVHLDIYSKSGQREPRLRLMPDGTFRAAGEIHRTTIGSHLDVDDFDALYVCAMSFGAPLGRQIAERRHILADVQSEDWPNPDGLPVVSRAEFRERLYNRLLDTGVPRFLRSLSKRGYGGKVIAQLPPPPSDRLVSNSSWILRLRWGAQTRTCLEDYMGMAYGVVRQLLLEHSMPVTILPCPPQALLRGVMRPPYSHRDNVHGNRDYGRLVLRALARELGTRTETVALPMMTQTSGRDMPMGAIVPETAALVPQPGM